MGYLAASTARDRLSDSFQFVVPEGTTVPELRNALLRVCTADPNHFPSSGFTNSSRH